MRELLTRNVIARAGYVGADMVGVDEHGFLWLADAYVAGVNDAGEALFSAQVSPTEDDTIH